MIVQAHGLNPIVQGVTFAADELEDVSNKSDRELTQIEELATQCARALRNLSVNRKLTISIALHCVVF